MRRIIKAATAIAMLAGSMLAPQAHAAFVGLPGMLRGHLQKIALGGPTLAPFGHTLFCMQYPGDCTASHNHFRPGPIALDDSRWNELRDINREVNGAIRYEHNYEGIVGERWLIAPKTGDCNDYAVTKRHELIARGWPAHALLLAEVVTTWGEHHLVLVVRTKKGDLVADSIEQDIRPWTKSPYQWVRIQSPKTPTFWAMIGKTQA
ncbi:transglutaminase-like cysteine peptidase [Bradyrhizobium sp. Gha]|uniref:transglutaminase-like cysteine peptidase n=1 Tax=Bradyrhizobium sp. Gha TaxID=1855318 RepID=UPI0008F2F7DD|nr:transglutaminase-like cysteine peptidase [Bradyrhizobium sp. Gha]SFI08887.1 Predicted transglutaminase-like cysteine proteinase [Bradyrhizobium sp. Gha]